MKIEYINETSVEFKDLSVNRLFIYENELFIKINVKKDDNSIYLSRNRFETLNGNEKVLEVEISEVKLILVDHSEDE